MIVSEPKPFREILTLLKPYEKVAILGCSECAAACEVGGEKEVEAMKNRLEEAGKTVPAAAVLTTSCSVLLNKKELRGIKDAMSKADVILSLACGDGVQTLAEQVDIPVIPGSNTMYLGKRERAGVFKEMCKTCGSCVLGRTAGICPVTQCGKGLLNGPCGGQKNGKCEVIPENDCAWITIYNKLSEQGRLSMMERPHMIRGYENDVHPRSLDLREKKRLERQQAKEAQQAEKEGGAK